MADKKSNEQKSGGIQIKLIRHITLAPERRNEPSKGAYPAGRFKMGMDILRSNLSNLAIVNILTLLFALPLLAALGFMMVMGAEKLSYIINGIKTTPYLLTDFGIGLSQGAVLSSTKAAMLVSYKLLFLAIAASLPILGFGMAGIYHIVTKLVWGESFICKKDKYGNDIPRMVIEYFRGVKLFWKQTVVIMSVFAVILAGVSNLIILFVQAQWLGNLNAGHWIGLIMGCIIGLISVMVLFNLLPMVVAYDLPLIKKLKNAALLTVAFFIPSFIILAISALPFLLMIGGPMLRMLAAVVMSMIGFSYFGLISANYLGYNSEKIIVPLYEATIQTEKKKTKKAKTTNNSKKSK